MVLLLYAVVPSDTVADVEVGPSLRRLDRGAVGVVYEERDVAPANERGDIVSFGEAVQALASTGPVLPVRFGTVLPDLAGLEQLVEARGTEWRHRLDAVAGHVEVVVHARAAQSAAVAPRSAAVTTPPQETTGTEYLMARAAELRRESELRESLVEVLQPVVAEMRVLPGGDVLRLACLVEAAGVDALLEALDRWEQGDVGRLAAHTGPWPPFSFTDEQEES